MGNGNGGGRVYGCRDMWTAINLYNMLCEYCCVMRAANNKMCSSDIDMFIALYRSDRTHLKLSPIGNYHVKLTRERVEMYAYN